MVAVIIIVAHDKRTRRRPPPGNLRGSVIGRTTCRIAILRSVYIACRSIDVCPTTMKSRSGDKSDAASSAKPQLPMPTPQPGIGQVNF